jgi:deoxyribodipyrimidine photolyase
VKRARPVVVWFRRDLRVHDHPALTDAITRGRPVAPLFVLDPAILQGRFASSNRAWFVLGAITALRRELEARGGRLFVRVGDPRTVVTAFAREVGSDEVVVSRDYAPYGRRRDRAVAEALRGAGVEFHAKRGLLIHEPEEVLTATESPYTVFGPFQRRWAAVEMRSIRPAPDDIATIHGDDGPTPDLDDLRVASPTAEVGTLPAPGEPAARLRLDAWLESGPRHGPTAYHQTRDRLADPRCLRPRSRRESSRSTRMATDPADSSPNWRGATSTHMPCGIRLASLASRWTSAIEISSGTATVRRSAPGRTGGPATRSSTPRCASFGGPVGCRTARG